MSKTIIEQMLDAHENNQPKFFVLEDKKWDSYVDDLAGMATEVYKRYFGNNFKKLADISPSEFKPGGPYISFRALPVFKLSKYKDHKQFNRSGGIFL